MYLKLCSEPVSATPGFLTILYNTYRAGLLKGGVFLAIAVKKLPLKFIRGKFLTVACA